MKQNYSLTITFQSNDVRQINSIEQVITLVKKVEGSANMVTWVSFKPYEYNEVTWQNQYAIYASTRLSVAGATITKSSTVNPASPNQLYTFEYGTFNPPITGEIGTYQVKNEARPYLPLTFGLAQAVTANGESFEANPLNAVTVLPQETANFTPIEKIQAFLYQKINNGTIISEIQSPMVDLDLTMVRNQSIHYSNGIFINT